MRTLCCTSLYPNHCLCCSGDYLVFASSNTAAATFPCKQNLKWNPCYPCVMTREFQNVSGTFSEHFHVSYPRNFSFFLTSATQEIHIIILLVEFFVICMSKILTCVILEFWLEGCYRDCQYFLYYRCYSFCCCYTP